MSSKIRWDWPSIEDEKCQARVRWSEQIQKEAWRCVGKELQKDHCGKL